MTQPPQRQQPQRLTASQYQQLAQNWNQMPIQWNPDGVYGGIKEVRTGGRQFLYILPILSSLLLAIGVFLPWLSLNLFGSGFSTNGIGALSAPAGFVENMQKLSEQYGSLTSSTNGSTSSPTSQPYDSSHGWILLALAIICFGLAVIGIAVKSKNFSVGPLLIGLVCSVLGVVDWLGTSKLIDDTYKQATSPLETSLLNIQVGLGLYLVIIASLGLVIGAIIILTMFEEKPSF